MHAARQRIYKQITPYRMAKRELSGGEDSHTKKQLKKQGHELNQYMTPNTIYYPHPITEEDANDFNTSKREKPFDLLQGFIAHQNTNKTAKTIIHWFRNDLRVSDNTGFSKAIERCRVLQRKEMSDCRILTIFVANKHDWLAHLESNWKLNFMHRALKSLQSKLSDLAIPLHILEFDPKKPMLSKSNGFATWLKNQCIQLSKNEPVILTANAEYLTDELYRDVNVFRSIDDLFSFNVYHDTCVVEPNSLRTQQGSQYTVFAPWYKKWCAYLMERKSKADLVSISSIEKRNYNPKFSLQNFSYELPVEFTLEESCTNTKMPVASEEAGSLRLQCFLDKNIQKYDQKDILTDEKSSHLSVYLSAGVLSARTVVNGAFSLVGNRLVGKSPKDMSPAEQFIREIAWRDFYKHSFCYWPYLSMDIPFNLGSREIKWENDILSFEKWCYGRTGVPIVDAIMRKLISDGYINNRARMITASFLSKNLLIDWRWGERWFRKHLIDCDLSSNVGGWGFCSSTGIDAQPYFRIFSMERQSKAYDPSGNFIKKWVPQLKEIENVHTMIQNVHGYPDAIIDSKNSRQRAMEVYKDGLY